VYLDTPNRGRLAEVPHAHGMTLRVLSALPSSLIDSSSDPDRNGILQDPLYGF